MTRFSFAPEDDDGPAAVGTAMQIMAIAVRLVGVLLLVVGLVIALRVIAEAWALYSEPARIEHLAEAIERGSRLDASLAPVRTPIAQPGPGELLPGAETKPPPAAEPPPSVRLSYFAAWLIALLLLLLAGRLALGAVRVGGELALYDVKLRHVVRSLLREARQHERA